MINSKKYTLPAVSIILFWSYTANAQSIDTNSIFRQPVQLDTFTIKSGFDVSAFIRKIKNDTTFYKAFRSMRLVPNTAKNNIEIYGQKSNAVIASQKSISKQIINNKCRKTEFPEQTTKGPYYKKNGEFNYYTSALFDNLFFARDTVCNENDIVAGNMNKSGNSRMDNSKYKLKQLLFNPGSKMTGIPFMEDRAAIFDPGEAEKYDFKISMEQYQGQPCYLFRIKPKKEYLRKVVYNELNTWFRKSDFCILARDYSLSYHTLVYDFDVVMNVRTTQIGDKLYPSYISYNGNWHIFTKKREKVKFDVSITYDGQ
jgi:hypothetical protein